MLLELAKENMFVVELMGLTGALGLMTTLGFMLLPNLLGLLESDGAGPAAFWACCMY